MNTIKTFLIFIFISSYQLIAQETTTDYVDSSKLKEVTIEIYRDKTIEVGDRITFQLSEDVVINKQEYPRATSVYAYTSYNDLGRVMLDIKNINGDPIQVYKVEDYTDHLEGLYFGSANQRKNKKKNSLLFVNDYRVILKILEEK
jgi:hypothetical protein